MQAKEEVSVVNLRRRKSKTAAARVRRVGRIQHLGSVVCFPQGVRAGPYERIRVEKLRRYSTFVISSKESTRFFVSWNVQSRLARVGVGGKL